MPDITTQLAVKLETGSAPGAKNSAQTAISGDSGQNRSFFEAFQQSSGLQQAPAMAANRQISDPESGRALPLELDAEGQLDDGAEAFAARMVSLELPATGSTVSDALQTLLPGQAANTALTTAALPDSQTVQLASEVQDQVLTLAATPAAEIGSAILPAAPQALPGETLAAVPAATTASSSALSAGASGSAVESGVLAAAAVADKPVTSPVLNTAEGNKLQATSQPVPSTETTLRQQVEVQLSERQLQQTLSAATETAKPAPLASPLANQAASQPGTPITHSVDAIVARTEMLMANSGASTGDSGADSNGDNRQGLLQLASSLPAANAGTARSMTETAAAFSSLLPATGANAASPQALSGFSGQPGVMQAMISEAFGAPNWSQGLGRQVMMMLNQNVQSAEIRMNPANLGPIEVRINMDDDQVSVAFTSRHAVVREAMEMALPRLREMMNDNGLQLADTDISQQSFAEQRAATDSGADAQAGTRDDSLTAATNEPSAVHGGAQADADSRVQARLDGMVDYYI